MLLRVWNLLSLYIKPKSMWLCTVNVQTFHGIAAVIKFFKFIAKLQICFINCTKKYKVFENKCIEFKFKIKLYKAQIPIICD